MLVLLVATACTSSGQASSSLTRTRAAGVGAGSSAPAAAAPTAAAKAFRPGQVFTRQIPGGSTGFTPRPAVIYLPPAARTHPHERFPVLVLLHGTTGHPTDWITLGRAAQTLDRFAAAHGGRAPVVVMPDINGSLRDDTECIRTTGGGDVERYLLDVLPAWIRRHLPVSGSARSWGIAGLSEGGTCALILGLRGAATWSFIGDFSGLRRVTVGDTDDPTATIAQLFGGSRTAYDAHDPGLLMRHHRYRELSVWFECGARDTPVVADQTALATIARRSVRSVHASTTPGSHSWAIWRTSLAAALPWFWTRSS